MPKTHAATALIFGLRASIGALTEKLCLCKKQFCRCGVFEIAAAVTVNRLLVMVVKQFKPELFGSSIF